MALKEQIQEDMKNAMRAKDQRKLGVIRLILAAIKQREVDERITLDDNQILIVIEKMVKQRRDSISHYQKANRTDLVDQESFEIDLLQTYLPTQLSETEINTIIQKAITESGAKTMQDMGKIMAVLKPQLQGRADMSYVSKQLKTFLEQQ